MRAGQSGMRSKSIESVILMLLALTATGEGIRIIIQQAAKLRGFQAGGYLVLIGLLLAGMTVLYWRREPEHPWDAGDGTRWVMIATLILGGYTLLLPLLGYLLSSLIAFVIYLRVFGRYRWRFILGLSCVLSVGSAWLWDRLAIGLPSGPLPWP